MGRSFGPAFFPDLNFEESSDTGTSKGGCKNGSN